MGWVENTQALETFTGAPRASIAPLCQPGWGKAPSNGLFFYRNFLAHLGIFPSVGVGVACENSIASGNFSALNR
jgi:hypothetical protein